jgi:hypothetical protein
MPLRRSSHRLFVPEADPPPNTHTPPTVPYATLSRPRPWVARIWRRLGKGMELLFALPREEEGSSYSTPSGEGMKFLLALSSADDAARPR